MQLLHHPAGSRGHFDHGWLQTWHSFSFGDYHDPERMGFGTLRVLNDDIVQPGQGFGLHPHRDMEIVTLMLAGTLQHRDSLGHGSKLEAGEVQVMSAGSGIRHSEANASASEELRLLQIWVLPRSKGGEPRYAQGRPPALEPGRFTNWVGPDDSGLPLWIHQDAWFSVAELAPGQEIAYTLVNAAHGVYFFLISGGAAVAGVNLAPHDALAVAGAPKVPVVAREKSRLLAIEVPAN